MSRAQSSWKKGTQKPPFLDFFAGSGLVTEALRPIFAPVWANDICEKKARVYTANHGSSNFQLGPIEQVKGLDLPDAILSWASFPCQDLSLAGNLEGIESDRSGLVWEWLRVMDEMRRRPPIAVAENVMGLISAERGEHYKVLHRAMVKRGYKVGAVVLDGVRWVPQSRPRVFVICVDRQLATAGFCSEGPVWCHPAVLQRAVRDLADWVWWSLPEPAPRRDQLDDLVELHVPCREGFEADRTLHLIPERHQLRLEAAIKTGKRVFPGYKRIRQEKQVLELRFDGIAGCLRTPVGGSSRQFLVFRRNGSLRTRLLTVLEAVRLMGAPDSYKLPGTYNECYHALGDAVVVPAVRHLAKHLLGPISKCVSGRNGENQEKA